MHYAVSMPLSFRISLRRLQYPPKQQRQLNTPFKISVLCYSVALEYYFIQPSESILSWMKCGGNIYGNPSHYNKRNCLRPRQQSLGNVAKKFLTKNNLKHFYIVMQIDEKTMWLIHDTYQVIQLDLICHTKRDFSTFSTIDDLSGLRSQII